jgi:hypothetical protein
MAKQRHVAGRPADEEPGRRKRAGVPLHVWLDPALAEAFAAYLDSLDPRPTITSAVTAALKRFLREKGAWPPPASG